VKINCLPKRGPIKKQPLAFGALIPLKEVIKSHQVERDLAVCTTDAFWIFPQYAQPILIPVWKMIALAVFAMVIISLSEERHWGATVGTIHHHLILASG
jgi:hypothetical protein